MPLACRVCLILLVGGAVLVSCHAATHKATQPQQFPWAAQARAGVQDAGLADLLVAQWDLEMSHDPLLATYVGDHRFDDRVEVMDAVSITNYEVALRALAKRASNLPSVQLAVEDRLTLELLRNKLESSAALVECKFHLWRVQAGWDSVLSKLNDLAEVAPLETGQDGKKFVTRVGAAAREFDHIIENLRAGKSRGFVASKETLRRAIAQLDAELAKPPTESPLLGAVRTPSKAISTWAESDRLRFSTALTEAVTSAVWPALTKFRNALRDELLPVARDEKEGLIGLPNGKACYTATIREHLGEMIGPEELHQLGLGEIEKTDAEIASLGKKLFRTADLRGTIAHLRSDRSLYFTSGEEIIAKATALLARAQTALTRAFGKLPKARCVVSAIPANEAPFTTMARYVMPTADGKPGQYFVNTFQPYTRPRYEFEVLTWHEAIPGHHVQFATAQERGELPAFRRYSDSTAYVEGWALYAEGLADELGLYSSNLDRIGKVSFDAWRAARLVVDTGIHAFGWSRSQAESFMRAHTALSFENISNEVDRYVAWPGQALAYKYGQLQFWALRRRAEAQLGSRFSLSEFHDTVLAPGAVTMPILRRVIDEWITGASTKQ